ncbi:MAG: dicarboxylate/amino acid:cation symporter [Treponemataceae bacterium]
MKIWIKYLIGCALGILAAIFLPNENDIVQKSVSFLTEFAINFGRWTLLPVLFFSMTISVCNLREEQKLFKLSLSLLFFLIISSFALTLLGIIPALIIKLPRIPISVEKILDPTRINILENILKLFPSSGFSALVDGSFLVPLYILAGFAGAGFSTDKATSKPAFNLFDSLSHICYHIMSFFVDALAIGMVAIVCNWTFQFIQVASTGIYTGFIIMLIGILIVVIAGIYPMVLRFVFKELHPYKVLYASIATILTAFFSMDSNLALVVNIKHSKDSLGIRRRANTICMPVISAFGRGGAACVTAASFVVILRSYTGLGIGFSDVLWIILMSFLFSFTLSSLPIGGPFATITIMCSLYGRGFDAGYLLLKPAIPVICAAAASIDATNAIVGSYIIASKNKWIERKDIKKYI